MTSAGPVAGGAGEVGEHGRRLAEAHVEREAAAELDGVEEAEPGQRLGLVAAQLADEALGRGDRRRRRRRWRLLERCRWPSRCRRRRRRRRAPSPRGRRSWRRISAPVSWVIAVALGQRGGGLLRGRPGRARPTGRATARAGGPAAASRAISAAVSSTSSNTTDQRDVAQLVGADDRARRSASANSRSDGRRPCAATARAPARRSRRPRASGR